MGLFPVRFVFIPFDGYLEASHAVYVPLSYIDAFHMAYDHMMMIVKMQTIITMIQV